MLQYHENCAGCRDRRLKIERQALNITKLSKSRKGLKRHNSELKRQITELLQKDGWICGADKLPPMSSYMSSNSEKVKVRLKDGTEKTGYYICPFYGEGGYWVEDIKEVILRTVKKLAVKYWKPLE